MECNRIIYAMLHNGNHDGVIARKCLFFGRSLFDRLAEMRGSRLEKNRFAPLVIEYFSSQACSPSIITRMINVISAFLRLLSINLSMINGSPIERG